MNLKKYNKAFRVVFQPNDADTHGGRKRFLVSANSLQNYVGSKNAFKAILRAFSSREYKYTVRLRKFEKRRSIYKHNYL